MIFMCHKRRAPFNKPDFGFNELPLPLPSPQLLKLKLKARHKIVTVVVVVVATSGSRALSSPHMCRLLLAVRLLLPVVLASRLDMRPTRLIATFIDNFPAVCAIWLQFQLRVERDEASKFLLLYFYLALMDFQWSCANGFAWCKQQHKYAHCV